jgi:hypothetical protein
MFGALYVAELMAVGKKRSSLRATLIIAVAYAIIGEISILLLSPISPILVVIVQITSLLLLVQHYYESNWLVIFTVTLAIAFVIILGLALLSIVFEPPRPY